MEQSITDVEYYLDTQDSELSILRLNREAVNTRLEEIDVMERTVVAVGADSGMISTLRTLAAEARTKDIELYNEEINTLTVNLSLTGLSDFGLQPSKHGISFGYSGLGDGTLPVMRIGAIVNALNHVFHLMKAEGFADLTFNGVVSLKSRTDQRGISIHVRNSLLTVQRPTTVWENITDLVMGENAEASSKGEPVLS